MKNIRFLTAMSAVLLLSIKSFAQVASNEEFSGSYKMHENNANLNVVKVYVKDGLVNLSLEGFPDFELAKGKTGDEFTLESLSSTITFMRKGGKVTVLKIVSEGGTFLGEKEGSTSSIPENSTLNQIKNTNSQNGLFIDYSDVFLNQSDKKYYSKGVLASGKIGNENSYYTLKNGVVDGLVHYFFDQAKSSGYGNGNAKFLVEYIIKEGKVNGDVIQGGWKFKVLNNQIVNFPIYEDENSKLTFEKVPSKSNIYLIKRTLKSKINRETKISYKVVNDSKSIFKFKPYEDKMSGSSSIMRLEESWEGGKSEYMTGILMEIYDTDYTNGFRYPKETDENGNVIKEIAWDTDNFYLKYRVSRLFDGKKLITTDSISYLQPGAAINDYMKNKPLNILDPPKDLLTKLEYYNDLYSNKYSYTRYSSDRYDKDYELWYLYENIYRDGSNGEILSEFFTNGEIKRKYYLDANRKLYKCPYEEYELVDGKRKPIKTCIVDTKKRVFIEQEYFPDGYPKPAIITSY